MTMMVTKLIKMITKMTQKMSKCMTKNIRKKMTKMTKHIMKTTKVTEREKRHLSVLYKELLYKNSKLYLSTKLGRKLFKALAFIV